MSNDPKDHTQLALRQQGLSKNLNKSLTAGGSLADLVKKKSTVFEGKIVFLLDCSGSMGSRMYTGQTRIAGLRDAVKEVQKAQDGLRIPMIQFGAGWDEVGECLEIPDPEGGTPLHKAIDLAKTKEYGRAICISDGMPDSQTSAIEAAKRFGGRIDVIFTGNTGEPGEAFLKHLAELTGGEMFTGDLADIKQITGTITLLLGTGSDDDDDEKGAIQL